MPTKRIQCDEPILKQSNDCADNRLRGIVGLVTANSNWGQPLPPRQARGIAAHRTFTFKEGRTEQSNYIDYLVARTDITPQTNVYFVENDHRPGGVGEPGGAADRAGDLQRDQCGNRHADQGIAGRPAAVEALQPATVHELQQHQLPGDSANHTAVYCGRSSIDCRRRCALTLKEESQMHSNRGVVYVKPGKVEVQNIDFPTFRDPAGKTIEHGVILKIVVTNIYLWF